MKRRILSMLLVVLMMVSLVPVGASAATNGHTAQEALAWVRSQLGKSLDYDGVYGAQCVDLIKYYYDYLGCASYARGNGADYASNALPSGWARYQGAQPQPGDILVYGGNSSNPYGHVAIYESDYVTYHQNFNGKQYVVKFTGKYNSCTNPYWGVVRPDFSAGAITGSWEGPTISQITETNARLDGKLVYNGKPNTTKMGVRIYDSSNKLVASKDESVNYNYTYVTIWYVDLASELGITLVSGQTYKVVFYAIANGKEYWSPTVSFTTLHTHKYTSKITAPTCTSAGYTTHTCSCGNSYKDTYVDALGHNYVNGVCTRCNAKDPNYQAPHTHSYIAAVTAPTCTSAGYTTYTCSCGYSYKDNWTDALGHSYTNGTCVRCGSKDPSAAALSFVDVPSTSYCYDAVQWAVANGVTAGTDSTHFSPNAGCTRAQVVTFLWRAAGKPTVNTYVNFVDVKSGAYYYEAVKWAVANGITAGTDAAHFSPNATCTRGQVVTFLYRAAKSPSVSTVSSFSDVAAGSYCYNAVSWAVTNGITAGTGGNRFSPNATCTRGQVVTFLYRAQ